MEYEKMDTEALTTLSGKMRRRVAQLEAIPRQLRTFVQMSQLAETKQQLKRVRREVDRRFKQTDFL